MLRRGYLFSGVRPSPGAAMLGRNVGCEPIHTLENAELAVAEDGHTPLNRYGRGRSALRMLDKRLAPGLNAL
jgi:hypothetical protein